MRSKVVFTTDMFPDESEAIEREGYYRPGKYCAEWLASKLPEHEIRVASVGFEDWGWYVAPSGDHDRILIGCSKLDDADDQWLCFAEEEGRLSRWLGRFKGKPNMQPVVLKAIDAILKSEPRIRDIGWVDETRPGWDGRSSDPFAAPGQNDVMA